MRRPCGILRIINVKSEIKYPETVFDSFSFIQITEKLSGTDLIESISFNGCLLGKNETINTIASNHDITLEIELFCSNQIMAKLSYFLLLVILICK